MKYVDSTCKPLPWAVAVATAGVVLLSACASTPPPSEELAVGRAAVERASAYAADAPVTVAAAREKLDRANLAYAKKDYELARQLAQQAEADATLAEAQARTARSDRALVEVREGIQQLRNEMTRK